MNGDTVIKLIVVALIAAFLIASIVFMFGGKGASSELNNAFAWVQRFSDGNQYDNDKAYDDNVRAIRSFTP